MTQKLNLEQIQAHWENWAKTYGKNLRATTKTSTAKQIELDCLSRNINEIASKFGDTPRILEIGCGNGYNLIYLAKIFKHLNFDGIDFINEMICAANSNLTDHNIPENQISFQQGNILNPINRNYKYDLAFSVRCLINLDNEKNLAIALNNISNSIKPNGFLMTLENSEENHKNQNFLRSLIGLPNRNQAEFNRFISNNTLEKILFDLGFELIKTENFIDLHDIVLYILTPMINNGEIDYSNPIVQAAANLNIALSSQNINLSGSFGQNKMHLFRKKSHEN